MTLTRPDRQVIAVVDGRPLTRASTDARVAGLRAGPLHALLPEPDTAEARQLVRWAAQVEMVIALCRSEASRRGLPADDGAQTRLERRAAVELGSVATAAWEHSEAVRSVADTVPVPAPAATPAPVDDDDEADYLLRHRRERSYEAALAVVEAGDPLLVPVMGWSRRAELPPAVAALLGSGEASVTGRLLGPAQSSLGWHVVAVDGFRLRPGDDPGAGGDGAARRREFLRWLVDQQAARVVIASGFEHPGDPRQPDNHHRH